MMFYRIPRQHRSRVNALRTAREKYPFRLVRSHSLDPRPETIDPEVHGNFSRFPMKDGDEWLFETREGRDLFLKKYGGTILGE